MQKYKCTYTNDLGNEFDAMSEPDEHGDWYRAEDVDARITELKGKLIKCGIERSWFASKYKQAMDIMEANDPLNARALNERPAWDDQSGTGN